MNTAAAASHRHSVAAGPGRAAEAGVLSNDGTAASRSAHRRRETRAPGHHGFVLL